jgi:hypothetical protein
MASGFALSNVSGRIVSQRFTICPTDVAYDEGCLWLDNWIMARSQQLRLLGQDPIFVYRMWRTFSCNNTM